MAWLREAIQSQANMMVHVGGTGSGQVRRGHAEGQTCSSALLPTKGAPLVLVSRALVARP